MTESEPRTKKKRRFFRMSTPLLLSGSLALASAGIYGDVVLSMKVFGHSPASSVQVLPDNPCTQLQPFQDSPNNQRSRARECIQIEKGTVVIVDFTGLSKKDENAIAGYTKQFFKQSSDGILAPTVIALPASQEAQKMFSQTAPNPVHGCVPVPDAFATPSAFALKTMPEVRKYPHALIISLSSQKACHVGGEAYGGTTLATVYPDNIINSGVNHDQSIASDVAHEGSHLFNLNHAHTITFGSNTVSGSPRYPTEMISFKLSKFTIQGEVGNIMGLWNKEYTPVFNQIQDDILRWPQAVLSGKQVLQMRQFEPGQHLALSEKEIENGGYAITKLADPLTLPVGDDGQGKKLYGTFDTIAILPALSGDHLWKGSDSYTLRYMLFDSTKTHNTAIATDAAEVDMNGNLTVTIDGNQVIRVAGSKKGLVFSTSDK